jgi:hypothetical protein
MGYIKSLRIEGFKKFKIIEVKDFKERMNIFCWRE